MKLHDPGPQALRYCAVGSEGKDRPWKYRWAGAATPTQQNTTRPQEPPRRASDVFYGSNLYRKDNPRWVIGNATETPKVPEAAYWLLSPVSGACECPVSGLGGSLVGRVTRAVCDACALGVALLIGLPRRVGVRLHATNDAEARWWHWQVTERSRGLVRQYRDARFDVVRHNPAIRRDGLGAELADEDPAPPGCTCGGDL
jgi:hypothetical protein